MLIFELVLPNCPTFFVTTSHIPFVCYQISHIIAQWKGVQHHISVIWVSLVLKAEKINCKSGRRTWAACAERKFWEKYEYRQSVCQRPYQTRRTKQNNMLSNLRTQFLLRKCSSPVDQYVWSAFPQFYLSPWDERQCYLSPWDGKGKQLNNLQVFNLKYCAALIFATPEREFFKSKTNQKKYQTRAMVTEVEL